MDIFTTGLGVLIAFCTLLYYYTYTVAPTVKDANFINFQRVYLAVYFLAMSEIHFCSFVHRRNVQKIVFYKVKFHKQHNSGRLAARTSRLRSVPRISNEQA